MNNDGTHFDKDSIVVVYLSSPKERYWGILNKLTDVGLSIKGIDLNSFEDWCRQVGSDGDNGFDLTSMFFPMARLEKVILDESSGSTMSLSERFEQITGTSVERHLEL